MLGRIKVVRDRFVFPVFYVSLMSVETFPHRVSAFTYVLQVAQSAFYDIDYVRCITIYFLLNID